MADVNHFETDVAIVGGAGVARLNAGRYAGAAPADDGDVGLKVIDIGH